MNPNSRAIQRCALGVRRNNVRLTITLHLAVVMFNADAMRTRAPPGRSAMPRHATNGLSGYEPALIYDRHFRTVQVHWYSRASSISHISHAGGRHVSRDAPRADGASQLGLRKRLITECCSTRETLAIGITSMSDCSASHSISGDFVLARPVSYIRGPQIQGSTLI